MGSFNIAAATAIFFCATMSAFAITPQLQNHPLLSLRVSLFGEEENGSKSLEVGHLRAARMQSMPAFVQVEDQGTSGDKSDESEKKPEKTSHEHIQAEDQGTSGDKSDESEKKPEKTSHEHIQAEDLGTSGKKGDESEKKPKKTSHEHIQAEDQGTSGKKGDESEKKPKKTSHEHIQAEDQGTSGKKGDESEKKPKKTSHEHNVEPSSSDGVVSRARKQLQTAVGGKKALPKGGKLGKGKSVKELTAEFQARSDAAAKEKADIEASKKKELSPRARKIQDYFRRHTVDASKLSDEELKAIKDSIIAELMGLEKMAKRRQQLDAEAEERWERITKFLAQRDAQSEDTKKAMKEREARKKQWEEMKTKYGDVMKEMKANGIYLRKQAE